MNKKVVIGIVVSIVVFGILGYNKVKNQDGGTSGKGSGTTVNYVLAKEEEVTETFTSKGVVGNKKSDIIYSSNDGKILDFEVKVGDKVNIGDIIFTYDEQNLDSLEQSLEDAKINLNIARTSLKGNENNYRSATEVKEVDLLPFETQVHNSENSIEEIERQIININKEVENAKLTFEKEKADFENRSILFENGLISKVELDSYELALNNQEKLLMDLERQKKDLESSLESAKFNLDVANKNLNYAKTPVGDIVSQAENSVSIGELNVKQAELTLDRIEEKISNFKKEEYSTVSGVVTEIYVDKGDLLQEGTKVMEIIDTSSSNIIVTLDINQRNIYKVKEGQKVIVTSSGIGNEEVVGNVSKVMAIANIITKNTGNDSIIKVEVSFDGNVDDLKIGFTVDGEVVVSENEKSIIVPILSINIDDDGNYYLFIANNENVVEKRYIDSGVILSSDIVVTNVEVGERVIVSNLKSIAEGEKINPIEDN